MFHVAGKYVAKKMGSPCFVETCMLGTEMLWNLDTLPSCGYVGSDW